MVLTISILRCPDSVPPQTRQIAGGELSIGRGAENDWVLPDPERVLSKRHCVIAFRQGGWQVADLSGNGTFLNHEEDPIGPGRAQELRDGDRLRLGSYELELRVDEAPGLAPGFGAQSFGAHGFGGAGAGRAAPPAPHADPFGDDPFAPLPAPPGGDRFAGDPLLRAQTLSGFSSQVALPMDFDPLAPDQQDSPFAGPTQPDHAPAVEDAFRPPQIVSRLPDDWDLDLASPQPAPPQPAPLRPAPSQRGPIGPVPTMVTPPPKPLAPRPADPFDEPTSPPVPAAAPHPSVPAAPTADLLAAFLRGAGLEDAKPADAAAAMEQLGAAFRATVAGIRHTLIARATVKGEFRIKQTMIQARGNNPLKFSAGDDDALAALIGVGRRTDMPAAAAIAEALRDIRLHELASMAAMQVAVRALLARLDPAPLRLAGERAGGMLPAQRRARAFELFEQLHGEVSRALADDFDSVFGKAFAQAYEQALNEASDKEDP
jgi:type VI secretion system protein ImpI